MLSSGVEMNYQDEDVEAILADKKAIKVHNEAIEKAADVADRFTKCFSKESLVHMVAAGIAEEIRRQRVET